jgi:3-methyl-2-oxobutanoate hydroxymethyltransferase
MASAPQQPEHPLRALRQRVAAGHKFACLTCYDATTARWLEASGVHVLLVGDTAAEMVLGFDRTIDMPFDVLLALTAGVKRGAPRTLVMGDIPFMTYHANEDDAIVNAGRFLTQGRADIVKLEVDASHAPLIARMARAGIPVCAHVGSRPQLSALQGGYVKAGKDAADADAIVLAARAAEEAGAAMLLIEAVPHTVTDRVREATTLPLIGIGAGPNCHGQVLVLHDLLGLTTNPPPFAKPIAQLGASMQSAVHAWVQDVTRGSKEWRGR